jgi:hypothetical protein
MSQLLINDYLKQLDLIKKVSGSQRETIVREAFKDLLKAWGRQHDLIFLAEYPLKTATKTNIAVDGALLHELRMPLGYWEAKDADDDLNEEVSKKFKRGYPQDNIIFSDDAVAVLWQNRAEVLRCDMTDTQALSKLLKLFFSFERPEIAGFRAAVEQFKTDLPAVLQALREMIEREHEKNPGFRAAEDKFLLHAQEAINPALGDADVREMLIQHILTEEIFAKVFDDSDFHQHNNVARELPSHARTIRHLPSDRRRNGLYRRPGKRNVRPQRGDVLRRQSADSNRGSQLPRGDYDRLGPAGRKQRNLHADCGRSAQCLHYHRRRCNASAPHTRPRDS